MSLLYYIKKDTRKQYILLDVNSCRPFSHLILSIGYPENGQYIMVSCPATAFIGPVARTYGGPLFKDNDIYFSINFIFGIILFCCKSFKDYLIDVYRKFIELGGFVWKFN